MSLVTISQENKATIHGALWFGQNDFFRMMDLIELNQVHQEIINQFKEALRN